jgi:glutaredoxin
LLLVCEPINPGMEDLRYAAVPLLRAGKRSGLPLLTSPTRNGRRFLIEAVSHQTERSQSVARDDQDHTGGGLRPSRVGLVCISDSEPDHGGASMTLSTTTLATRQLQIEFLFLDLDTCTRCRATDQTLLDAIERTRPALDAAGVTVSLTKTLVATEAQAQQLGFVSSPTIRIDGVDIAGELVESACDTCRFATRAAGRTDGSNARLGLTFLAIFVSHRCHKHGPRSRTSANTGRLDQGRDPQLMTNADVNERDEADL